MTGRILLPYDWANLGKASGAVADSNNPWEKARAWWHDGSAAFAAIAPAASPSLSRLSSAGEAALGDTAGEATTVTDAQAIEKAINAGDGSNCFVAGTLTLCRISGQVDNKPSSPVKYFIE